MVQGTFLMKQYHWCTKKYEDILNQLDAKYPVHKIKTSGISRAVGGVSDNFPPKFLVKNCFWAVESSTVPCNDV